MKPSERGSKRAIKVGIIGLLALAGMSTISFIRSCLKEDPKLEDSVAQIRKATADDLERPVPPGITFLPSTSSDGDDDPPNNEVSEGDEPPENKDENRGEPDESPASSRVVISSASINQNNHR